LNWKLKAFVQNLVGRLPAGLGQPIYYAMQSGLGRVHRPSLSPLLHGKDIAQRILAQGASVLDKHVLEVGTGRGLQVPMALWLCGAGRITTVDIDRLLRTDIVLADIALIRERSEEVVSAFDDLARTPVFADRFRRLAECPRSLDALLEMMHIDYRAPGDAAHVDLPAGSIDFHVSRTVLEHVPPAVIRDILTEGQRLLRADGLLVHLVDFSDHFAHIDAAISEINFLRFTDRQWRRYGAGRFTYHNRLRVDEMTRLFESAGVQALSVEPAVNARALRQLQEGFPLDDAYKGRDLTTLATSNAWLVARPGPRT
jgi:SAM-dependent methyltransferase